jgi:hypothetical protein
MHMSLNPPDAMHAILGKEHPASWGALRAAIAVASPDAAPIALVMSHTAFPIICQLGQFAPTWSHWAQL